VTVSLAWLGVTTWLIWRAVGVYFPQLDHQYFRTWMLCSLLSVTPIKKLPVGGSWYPLNTLSDWLSGPQLYRHTFGEAFWHLAMGSYGLGTDLIPLSLVGLLIMWRWRHRPDGLEHIRGLQLVSARELERQLNGSFIKRMIHGRPRGIRLGNITIPEQKEFEHFILSGNSGSGKSTSICLMLDQIAERGQSPVIIDPEGEYVQKFYSEARGDWILNPLDARCPYWSPWAEIREEWFRVDAAAIAASLIRGNPRDDNQRFFLESTRTVVEAILQVVSSSSYARDLLGFVGLSPKEIHDALKGTPAYALIDPGAVAQQSGILGTAVNEIKTFVHLAQREQTTREWSAREWAERRQGWIFLPSREDIRDSIHVLQGLWLDCLVRWLMTAEIGSEQVWIVADEVAALGYQPQMEKLLTRGRKRGLAVVLGLQNVSQLRAIYGAEGAVTLTSSPTTKLLLRVDEPETARWASDLIGEHEVERLQMTQLAGLSSFREGINLSPQRQLEHLVLPSEIQMLQPFQGYACIAGHNRATIRIPQVHLPCLHPAFIARPRVPVSLPQTPDTAQFSQIDEDDDIATGLLSRAQ
jgi:type IV secretory pathway TraG/TraD family ATPase VirD4